MRVGGVGSGGNLVSGQRVQSGKRAANKARKKKQKQMKDPALKVCYL